MYQITDGTFSRRAAPTAFRDHAVVEDGPWERLALMLVQLALIPGWCRAHAVEMTAALLERQVNEIAGRQRVRATPAAEAGSRGGDPPVRRRSGPGLCPARFSGRR